MDMSKVMEGVYNRFLRGETIPVKPEFLSSVLSLLKSRGHEVVTQPCDDGVRTNVSSADAEELLLKYNKDK
jgi:hypothetical protein